MNPPEDERSWLARWLLPTLVIVGTFYMNIAGILKSARVDIVLPRPQAAVVLFQMFGLFSNYGTNNHNFEVQARVVSIPGSSAAPRWIELDLSEYFPEIPGAVDRRLRFPHERKAEREQYYQRMIELLKSRYNHQHADEPIDRVRIDSVHWPKSVEGFKSRYEERKRRFVSEG